METQLITKSVEKSSKIDLVTFQIKRGFKGTVLFIQSKPFEDFFKTNGLYGDTYSNMQGDILQTYNMFDCDDSKMTECLSGGSYNRLITRHGYVNANWLKTVGIENGITIKIDSLNSKQAVDQFKKDFKELANKIYEQYMKPSSTKVTIQVIEERI